MAWRFGDEARGAVVRPKASAAGEFEIHAGSCTGPLLATLPLAAATAARGQTELDAHVSPPQRSPVSNLCIFATGDPRDGQWALARVAFSNRQHVERAAQGRGRQQEVKPVSNLHRKHPVSIAVSMALLSAMAATATASPGTGAPAETPEAQAVSPQDTATTPSPKSKPKPGEVASGGEQTVLSTVTVIGVRASQMRAIDLKRFAPDIQDSISAESIGQLPDTTITDALQRITGVQIDRNAWRGYRGGRARPASSRQHAERRSIHHAGPDHIAAARFRNAAGDAVQSGGRHQIAHRKPDRRRHQRLARSTHLSSLGLPHGFTFSYNADGERGTLLARLGPEASGLVSFNDDGRWGLLVSADYSDTTRNGPESKRRVQRRLERGPRPVWRHPEHENAESAGGLRTASWGHGTVCRFLRRSCRIQTAVSM